jgi:hypothetical protein
MLAKVLGFLGLALLVSVTYSGLHRDRFPDILRLGLRRFRTFAIVTLLFAIVVWGVTEFLL